MCRRFIRDKGINSSSLSKYGVSALHCPSSAQYIEICSGKRQKTNDLKSIYHAPNEESGYERMQSVTKKWQEKYPNAMRRWEDNWDVLSPMFKFSAEVRKVMYTTNAIESLNSVLRRLNSQRSVFPSDTALLKALYLATFEATKKWTMPLRNWGRVYGELSIMYDGRLV